MLTNMITQHHNHPSVILWGLGNENDWPNDFPTFEQSQIRAFMKELNDLAHRLDRHASLPSAAVTSAKILSMYTLLPSGQAGIVASLPTTKAYRKKK